MAHHSQSKWEKLKGYAKSFGAGNWISTVIALSALIALGFQWKENQRRDREVADLRTLAVGLEKEVEQRRHSILYLLDHLDLIRGELWGRVRWNDDVIRKRAVLIYDQQALSGLALKALAETRRDSPKEKRIFYLLSRIGEKQRFLGSQLIGWADAESEAVKDFDAKAETLMQLRLSPDKEEKELDDIQTAYRQRDQVTAKHYDPIVSATQKELSDLGSELFDLLQSRQ